MNLRKPNSGVCDLPVQVFWVGMLLVTLSSGLKAQSFPMNTNQNNNAFNGQINYDLSAQYTVLMDPLYGYGSDENATNFSARVYWERYCAANPNDENAWFNNYRSTRFIAEGSAGFSELQADLDSISNQLKKRSYGTWEQLIVEYWNSNLDPKRETALQAAYKLRPNDPLTLRFMTGAQYFSGNQASVYDFYLKWKATGDLPLSTENYAYNVMQSIPKDAILITNGELDTYPLLYQLQTVGATGVKVVSIDLCRRAENRTKIFAYAGLVIPDGDLNSVIDSRYLERIAAANPNRNIYIASTCGAVVLKALQSDLYCTGLAFRYSTTPISNLTVLRDNVGQKFRLENIGKSRNVHNHFDVYYADNLEMNYYLPLLLAGDQFEAAGNTAKAGELRSKAVLVRKKAGYENPIRNEE